ncbi:MAG TPA: hypothetical protein VFF68_03075 [Anaerolineaceae bacterium]|nr:hypothetical protein [Anaerolineaceae bacterium]
MANTINLVQKFLSILAEIYKLESKTSGLDAMTQPIEFAAANSVKVMKLTTVGLGNYSRATGYPAGDITAEWVAMTLAAERGRSFSLDRMDNEETLGLVLGSLIRAWMREHVAPEFDAYRFAKYASTTGIQVVAEGATLASNTILAAFDAAMLALDEKEVPAEGRKLYISSTCNKFLEAAVTRSLENQTTVDRRVKMLDNVEVIPVPQTRFYTAITLNAGASSDAGGFAKAAAGKDINFMLLHPTAVLQPVKLNQVKYFDPDVNQISDGHLWQYRAYHDAFVIENHEDGIYLHHKA